MNTPTMEQREKLAQLRWTGVILFFFLVQAILWTGAFMVTHNDPSHAIVAHYHEQALHWDEAQAARQASSALGWKAEIKVDPTGDTWHNRAIRLKLLDRNQHPIAKADVVLQAFHRSRAAEVQTIPLTETEPGIYSGTIRVRHAGRWQFDGTATQGKQQFLIDQELRLTLPGKI